MKLLSIVGENFGVLHQRPLTFNGGLQVVYGPNEAGKSTLLRLIRETLFGFPYAGHELSWKAGSVAGEARLQLRDERIVTFRRQKGRPDVLSGHWEDSNAPIDEETIPTLLTGASSQLFNNLFAFSLRELFAGEESLREAGLGESLFTGGWGGLDRFRRVQQTLSAQRDELFKPRGRKQQLLRLQQEIQQCQQEYRKALVTPQELDRVREELQRLEADKANLQERLRQLQRQEHRLEQLRKALPVWRERLALLSQLSHLGVPEELTGDRAEELRRIKGRIREIEQELEPLLLRTTQAGDIEDQSLSAGQQAVLAQATVIKTLEQQLSQMQAFEQALPELERKRQETDRHLQAELDRIGGDWTLVDVAEMKIGLGQRELLAELCELADGLDRQESSVATRGSEVRQQLESTERKLQRIPEHRSLAGLEHLLDRADAWREQARQRDSLTARLTQLDADRHRRESELQQQLTGAGAQLLEVPADWSTWAVPLAATLEDWRERLDDATEQLRLQTSRVEQLQRELRDEQLDLAEFDRLHPQLDRDQLVRLRQRRNAGWDLIQRRLAGESVPSEEITDWLAAGERTDLPLEFEWLLLEADRLADVQFTQAELLARRDQLTARIERDEQRLADESELLQSRGERLLDLQQQWHSLWAPLQLEPGSPQAMLEWRKEFEAYARTVDEQRQTDEQLRQLTEQTAPFEKELTRTFPDAETPASALADAERELDAARQADSDRRQLEPELESQRVRMEHFDQELMQLAVQRGQLTARHRQLLSDLRFPETLSLKATERTLQSLQELRNSLLAAQELRTRVEEQSDQLQSFATEVGQLVSAMDPAGQLPSPTATLETLAARLAAAQQAEVELAKRRAEANNTSQQLTNLQRLQEQFQQQLAETLTAAGLSSEDDLTTLLDHWTRRQQLERSLAECDLQLQQLVTNFGELEDLNESDLAAQATEVKREIEQSEQRFQQNLQRAGALSKQLEDWSTSSQVETLADRLQSLRSEFTQGVERWAPLALADAMLQRALQRFEQLHRPHLLEDVGKWLQQLTAGRYRELQTSLDDPGVIRVVDEQGQTRTPDQLSTGTREQLFLAIRLAYVVGYAREHDPLPLVLDDVLVNFDDERARETLKALQQLAQSHQVLLLTCHQRTVALGQELGLPESVPLGHEAEQHLQSDAANKSTGKIDGRRKRTRSTSSGASPALFALEPGATTSEPD
ncbi:MAG: AAA family ATPase [Planctomycetaceae bacterium]|nr:AAA family ATPase [Planctomycetaceae bacterium]